MILNPRNDLVRKRSTSFRRPAQGACAGFEVNEDDEERFSFLESGLPQEARLTRRSLSVHSCPGSHGIVSNNFWDPVFKEKFISDYDCSNFDPKFWSEAEPIWQTLQKQGIDTGVYFWPGFSSYETKPTYYKKAVCTVNCSSIKDLPSSRKPIRSSYPPYDHCQSNYRLSFPVRIDSIISWLTSDKPPRFVALYVDEPDGVGHSDGPNSQKFKDAIEEVDRDAVGYIITKLRSVKLLDKVNLIFVADHNVVAVNKSRLIYLDDYLDPSTYTPTEVYSFAHLWPKEGKLEEVYANLTKLVKRYPQARVYKKDEIPEEYHYRNNRRIPPIYLFAGLGWMYKKSRGNISDDWVTGAHGYPASEKMGTIFYARGPSFKKGYKIDHALRSIDVYPMLCELLGIEPRPHNGSLGNMKMMMTPKAKGSSLVCHHDVVIIVLIWSLLLTAVL
ncbi:hypothetical protein QZH41_004372 [Actinostola sp. cb2023]|nr:hypothetical protein QZH41_004372 [Actinostola sp. cb2023]